MKKLISIFLIVSVFAYNAEADNVVTLKSGVRVQRIPSNKSFSDTRKKTIDGVTYFYHILKTSYTGVIFECADNTQRGEIPIGLAFEKVDVQDAKESITIPETIDGIPVVRVGGFKGYSRIKSISLPKSVISISGSAFEGCSSLETIALPQRLVEIQSYAFKGCRRLKSKFTFNNDVEIGWGVFNGCQEITSIRFNGGINTFTRESNNLKVVNDKTFADCRKLSDLKLPIDIRIIGDSAFSNCCSLSSINLSKNLHTIRNRVFADCKALVEIEIPLRIESVLSGTFSGCTALKSVKLPATLEELHGGTFSECTSLETIQLPNAITRLGDGEFKGCITLKSISIPDHVTELGVSCFEGCTSLRKVKLPYHLDNIKPRAFKDCSSLEALQLPPNVTTINSQAFEGCRKLASINIPNRVGSMGRNEFGSIGNHAFRGCDSLKSLRLNDGCHCYPHSLAGMTGLEELDIPASLDAAQEQKCHADPKEYRLDFGQYFKDSINLVKVNVRTMVNPKCPGTLKGIGGFKGFKKLKAVKLPEGLESIDHSAFEDCISLSEISLPSSVKVISSGAFAGCRSLKSVNLPEGVKIDTGAFKGCPAYTDPREEAERQARAAAEVAEREKAAKEASERQAREQERKAQAEEKKRREEQERKKWQEEETRREKENAEREKRLEELNKRLSKINDDVASKINDAQSGGSGSFILLLIVIASLAGGILAYAKKKGYTYLEGAREIARKVVTVISAMIANAKSKGGTDKQTESQAFQDVSSTGNTSAKKFACPHCGQHFEFDPDIAGMEADCPTCGHSFIVPEINDNAQ